MPFNNENPHQRSSYIEGLYGKEDEMLRAVRSSAPDKLSDMQIPPSTGKILQFLMQISRIKFALEIGTFVGYSAIWIARGLMPRGTLYTIEKSLSHYNTARHNISNSDAYDKVLLFQGDAIEILKKSTITAKMDAIFIDGAKAEYNQYLDLSLPYLKSGGLIIADNTLLFDTIYGDTPKDPKLLLMWNSVREFNERLAGREFFSSCFIPTDSGLSVAMKR